MAISIFDLFSVGIGPSSSHTVGPMRAAVRFVDEELGDVEFDGLRVDLYGSLSATGQGHGTFEAVLLGLEGWDPETVKPEDVDGRTEAMRETGIVQVGAQLGRRTDVELRVGDFVQRPLTFLPQHSNGMTLTAMRGREEVASQTYFSVGGGFVVTEKEAEAESLGAVVETTADAVPYPFTTSEELFKHCQRTGLPVSEIMLANELTNRTEEQVRAGVQHIWDVMEECKDSALRRTGQLPGGLKVNRRAPGWHERLWEQDPDRSHAYWQEWVNLVALAVNEENASGGRVVTAPTNGAAGIIPAVGFYATHYGPGATFTSPEDKESNVFRYLMTAAAIGVLYKEQASISGAEVGCQGEVGSAASMAAGGLCEVLGGTPQQVENAAEIAMEHNLGLTCDPIAGLVQVPCIERNAIGATKAVNAARMALMGDGEHRVSLDEVIVTMRETGRDMSSKYKETAQGGLAVNVVEC
ncbi:L-serine ammonia-lyase [Nesterenkonia marinintestina]|uniref:L-serine ammonia-lyase n=1 Tax=Nesterenkonia marinintestina TaxID=2979865 RepID=UPI0021BE1E7F|nr:L-serine ammonia-lyase [Nesterenkonia sp. GX14115]